MTLHYKLLEPSVRKLNPDIFIDISPVEHARINRLLFPQFPPNLPAKVVVPMGSGAMTPVAVAMAAAFVKRGLAQHIVITGGAKVLDLPETEALLPMLEQSKIPLPRKDEREADWACRLLRDQGMPAALMRVENTGLSTAQNIDNAIDIVSQFGNEANYISLPTPRIACKARELNPIRLGSHPRDWFVFTYTPVFPPGVTEDNWPKHAIARDYVAGELPKIDPLGAENYFATGVYQHANLAVEAIIAKLLLPQRAASTAPNP